jgi:sec-independent protein translocase protein TatC
MATKLAKPEDKNLISPEHEEEEAAVMGFFEHLEELRNRLFRAVMGIAVGMGISFFFTPQVLDYIKTTYGDKLMVIDPTDSIVVFFRLALMMGAILASPLITYQLLMFIMPGLTRKEQRWVLLSLPATTLLFLIGLAFTWFILVPAYVNFLIGFESDIFRVSWTADNYIGFLTAVLFWHAAAFETPVVFYILGRMGIVTYATMIKYWRHAVVVAAIIAAFITPTVDPLTMLVITLILVALYGLSVILVGVTTGFRREPIRR